MLKCDGIGVNEIRIKSWGDWFSGSCLSSVNRHTHTHTLPLQWNKTGTFSALEKLPSSVFNTKYQIIAPVCHKRGTYLHLCQRSAGCHSECSERVYLRQPFWLVLTHIQDNPFSRRHSREERTSGRDGARSWSRSSTSCEPCYVRIQLP